MHQRQLAPRSELEGNGACHQTLFCRSIASAGVWSHLLPTSGPARASSLYLPQISGLRFDWPGLSYVSVPVASALAKSASHALMLGPAWRWGEDVSLSLTHGVRMEERLLKEEKRCSVLRRKCWAGRNNSCLGASASASVLPMNIQGWFPLGLTGLITFQSKDSFKSLLQHYNSKVSVWCFQTAVLIPGILIKSATLFLFFQVSFFCLNCFFFLWCYLLQIVKLQQNIR